MYTCRARNLGARSRYSTWNEIAISHDETFPIGSTSAGDVNKKPLTGKRVTQFGAARFFFLPLIMLVYAQDRWDSTRARVGLFASIARVASRRAREISRSRSRARARACMRAARHITWRTVNANARPDIAGLYRRKSR